MAMVYQKPQALTDKHFNYCPGCTHGIITRLVAECIDELGVQGSAVGVGSVGCSVFMYDFLDVDFYSPSHGKAPAVATGVKRMLPDSLVFTYQGDGDLAAIGCSEAIHSAMRGEKITVIFVNNAIYGMTGGQMAPTTMVGQKATTSGPKGRDKDSYGSPIRMSEMIATMDTAAFVERVSVHDLKHVNAAKKAIKKAFETQLAGQGFTMVEVLSTCPTNWGLSPQAALEWLEQNMIPYYPLKNFKSPDGEGK